MKSGGEVANANGLVSHRCCVCCAKSLVKPTGALKSEYIFQSKKQLPVCLIQR